MLSEIWQNEKQRLATRLHQRVLAGRDAVICRELIGKGLPEIVEILVRKRAHQIFEGTACVNHERYDLSDQALNHLMKPLREALIAGTKFSSSELEEICRAGVGLQLDILVRPRAALCEWLFDSVNERSREAVLAVAEGFGEERPFIKKLLATIRELRSPRIFGDLFDTLTRATEQAVFKETPIASLLTDFKLLMEFESQVTGETCDAIRSSVVLAMLGERELEAQAAALAEDASGKERWTLLEIEHALERYWLVGAAAAADSASSARVLRETSAAATIF